MGNGQANPEMCMVLSLISFNDGHHARAKSAGNQHHGVSLPLGSTLGNQVVVEVSNWVLVTPPPFQIRGNCSRGRPEL